jgi:hypothetical protein
MMMYKPVAPLSTDWTISVMPPANESKIPRIVQIIQGTNRHGRFVLDNSTSMDQISIKTPNPKCRLFLKIDR